VSLHPDWSAIRAVVFDVDGTLYDSRRMRRAMTLKILGWLALHPWRVGEIRALQGFRKHREELADSEATGIGKAQYRGAAAATSTPEPKLRRIVEEWIHRRPLPLLAGFRVPGLEGFVDELTRRSIRIAVWSDYRAAEKLHAMKLSADLVLSAEDPEIDRMKPHPAGLAAIADAFGIEPGECLMIGDRDERDGEAARRLGAPYLLRVRGEPSSPLEFNDYFELLATLRQRQS